MNNIALCAMFAGMKQILLILALVMGASAARAECYGDYKAKKDSPLQLSYGVIALPDEACQDFVLAGDITRERIAAGGWTLLRLLSVFGPEGLEQRMESAAEYYLRY